MDQTSRSEHRIETDLKFKFLTVFFFRCALSVDQTVANTDWICVYVLLIFSYFFFFVDDVSNVHELIRSARITTDTNLFLCFFVFFSATDDQPWMMFTFRVLAFV